MKTLVFACALCLGLAVSSQGQGLVQFRNGVSPTLAAPIFGPEPSDPSIEKHGNTPGPPPLPGGRPAGTQTYGGAPLLGTGYTAQLWGAPLPPALDNPLFAPLAGTDPILQLVATTTFRANANAAGFTVPLVGNTVVPGVLAGERAAFDFRVWDNRGGTILSWPQVLADFTILRGQSGIFSPSAPLGGIDANGDLFIPPELEGLQSFNLHAVPEPGLLWLALGAVGVVWAARRRALI